MPVGNTPGAMAETTADLAFALLLAIGRNVVAGHRELLKPKEERIKLQGWFGFEITGKEGLHCF